MSVSKWVPVAAVILIMCFSAASSHALPLQKALAPAGTDNLLHQAGGYAEYGGYDYGGGCGGAAYGYYRSGDCTGHYGHYGHGYRSGCGRSYSSYGYYGDGYYRRAYRPYYDGDDYDY